ncbi:SAM-dependent DNA methyltransferase [Lachnospiraceae bacterium TF09-5]|nr:SAM-dependent DNA methyltransferase [Lachnospiraceae bacterium TF09-5]
MAVKKTQLYASLWASCDKLRGGMDSSEYKDYILTLLFMKYVTDKFKNKGAYEDIKVFDKAHDKDPDPEKRTGCSFDDFIALKGKKNIGEGMDKIIARLADENTDLKGVIDIAHFNDEKKLGSGKEMVDKLTDLISIFQRPELDFSRNKAEGDDIIGDAYEYLMRKFATESGKSKGQFYTPAEVSRILANVVGISRCTDTSATVCDPACGSGSLLIRAIDAAPFPIMGYGQEKESTTAGLAKMNAVLHRKAEITIKSGNTFSNPQYLDKSDNSVLERFDYIVANPPFSMKNWKDGVAGKEYGRFEGYGALPPEKQGDYAWLLHILKSLKSNGKAAVILPHGVLFRPNAEAIIRESIIKKHWIKGIISLPANLFYGTPIAACVLVIDKEGAANRQGIFMIDASHDFVKDGSKNRLRERDIYKITTTFNEQIDSDPHYARFVPNDEIEVKNGCNLNVTRYIDSFESEDVQDIYAHIYGGIPAVDIEGLDRYWEVFPSLKSELLSVISEKYYSLNVNHNNIRRTIYKNAEFSEYGEKLDESFSAWKAKEYTALSTLDEDVSARELIDNLAQDILFEFEHLTLIDKYDVYQVLLAYWNEVMNDDVSLIISEPDGYANARATDNIEEEITQGKNKGEMKVTGWEGRLIPKAIMIDSFFREEKNAIEEAENVVAETDSQLSDLIESADEVSALADIAENGKVKAKDIEAKIDELTSTIETEETIELEIIRMDLHLVNTKKRLEAYLLGHPLCKSAVNENGKITKASIDFRLRIIRTEESVPESLQDDVKQLKDALELCGKISDYSKVVKDLNKALDEKCRARYDALTDDEILDLLVNKKWFANIFSGIASLYTDISHNLTNRITELSERYEFTLPELLADSKKYEGTIKKSLEGMGFKW